VHIDGAKKLLAFFVSILDMHSVGPTAISFSNGTASRGGFAQSGGSPSGASRSTASLSEASLDPETMDVLFALKALNAMFLCDVDASRSLILR
jgi:hypothetical protein